jgi:hypothetical protein
MIPHSIERRKSGFFFSFLPDFIPVDFVPQPLKN